MNAPARYSRFRAEVCDIASDGRAVLRHPQGQVFFCSGVWLEEEGEFRVEEFRGRHGLASLLQLHRSSPHRRTPPCPHQGHDREHCGACAWQFIEYPEQLRVKQERVEREFAALGLGEVLKPIIGAASEWGYRNRAQFKTDGRTLGYVAENSHELVDVRDCPILVDANRSALTQLRSLLPNKQWAPKRAGKKDRGWTTLDIDEENGADRVSVNERLPFRQANTEQNEFMRGWLKDRCAALAPATVLELFCGAGNFTEVLASCGFARIVAVESSEQALEILREKSLAKVEVLRENLFVDTAFEKIYRHIADVEVLVLDPPREGLKNRKGLFRKKANPKHVFYVSCDLATLVRDVKDFMQHGYSVDEVQALDMFPQTPHVEILLSMKLASKNKRGSPR